MELKFNNNLISFAKTLSLPLYAVGGVVRNALLNSASRDVDLSAAIPAEEFFDAVTNFGFKVKAVYKRTGTVNFSDGQQDYEYTAFRREKYERGLHTPISTEFTTDVMEDALRRDFKCNAIYYDIKNDKIVDPLGGVKDIENRVLDTVKDAEKVFCSDGLRLLRLARFAGELNFKPTKSVLLAMQKYADNILDISTERIYSELVKILKSDKKYLFSDPQGHYTGLKILDETRVLDRILPELTEGRGMPQRKDFHKFDVLEHSLKCVLYADVKVRFIALLHDVGKPFCNKQYGKYHLHYLEGVKIADKILKRLKVDNKTADVVKRIVFSHMVDMNCAMKENKVRRFIVENSDIYEYLILIKQADFKASMESNMACDTVTKWNSIFESMKKDGTPFSLAELKISSKKLMEIGFKGEQIGKELKALFDMAVLDPKNNNEQKLEGFAVTHALKLDR